MSGNPARTPPVFSETQIATLQRILGPCFERALPGLETAVKEAANTLEMGKRLRDEIVAEQVAHDRARRALAHSTAQIAQELETAAGLLGVALTNTEALVKDAFLSGDLTIGITLADLSGTRTAVQRLPSLQKFLRRLQNDNELLETAVREWRERETAKSKGRRGRRPKVPVSLCGYVGFTLARAGVELSRGKSGRWARVSRVIYRAAGLEPPPSTTLERRLSQDHKYLADYIPHLLPQNPLHKFEK